MQQAEQVRPTGGPGIEFSGARITGPGLSVELCRMKGLAKVAPCIGRMRLGENGLAGGLDRMS